MLSIFFGFFLGAFPLAQFIFAPILGEYADSRGRRRIFLITLIVEVVGYALSGFAIQERHLSLLFMGRFLTGFAAGNMSVCLATLADLSKNEKTRTRYFGLGAAVAGTMFVLGPFLGGKLSDHTLYKYFSLAFPMWVGAFLAFCNLLFVFFFFKETLQEKHKKPLDPISSLHNIQKAFSNKQIQGLYLLYFFFLLGWNMLYQFLPALMVEKFHASSAKIGNLSALMGVIWIVGALALVFLKHAHISKKKLALASLLIFALATIFLPFPDRLSFFVLSSGVAVFCAGMLWPLFTQAISKNVAPEMQGKMLGLSQSVQSLSMALAPFLGGFILQAHNKIPFIVAAGSGLVALILLRKNHEKLF
jgi:DHA1 family tetracycline resistance protein-like MFS transporter